MRRRIKQGIAVHGSVSRGDVEEATSSAALQHGKAHLPIAAGAKHRGIRYLAQVPHRNVLGIAFNGDVLAILVAVHRHTKGLGADLLHYIANSRACHGIELAVHLLALSTIEWFTSTSHQIAAPLLRAGPPSPSSGCIPRLQRESQQTAAGNIHERQLCEQFAL